MSIATLKGAIGAVVARTSDESLVRELAARCGIPGVAPSAALMDQGPAALERLAERTLWEVGALRGHAFAPGGCYFVVDEELICRDMGGAAPPARACGRHIEVIATALGWSAATYLVEGALGGRAVQGRSGGWWGHATPIEGGGALLVLCRE